MPYRLACRRCGDLYEATRSDSLWCSHACRSAGRRERLDADAALGAAALAALPRVIESALAPTPTLQERSA